MFNKSVVHHKTNTTSNKSNQAYPELGTAQPQLVFIFVLVGLKSACLLAEVEAVAVANY